MNETENRDIDNGGSGEEKAAFREKIRLLYMSSADRLFAYSLGVCGNVEQARDIVSETFLKALENPQIFAEGFRPESWLFKVATNLMRSAFTRFLKRFLTFSNFDLDLRVSGGAQPDEAAVRNEEFVKLSAALRKLGRTDAEIVYLKYYESMSYSEISQIVGIAEGTVASKLSRALRRLENELK